MSAPSAIAGGDVAKTKVDGEAAEAIFKAFAGKTPLDKDTGDFFHFAKLSCQNGNCTATLSKAGHEMLLASGEVGTQMKVAGGAAAQAVQALTAAGASPAKVEELCCLTDGIKFACSFAAPASSGSNTTTTTTTTTSTTTTTTTTAKAKKVPITGSCYCGPHDGYCMIFRYGDDLALGYRKSDTCTVPQCQQQFGSIMLNECQRVWRVWPVQ